MSAKIAQALHQVMTECKYVQKTGRNDFHRYTYASEADLLGVLRPAMINAGLLLLPSVREVCGPDDNGNTTVIVDYTLAHKDGDVWPDRITAVGTGNDRSKDGKIGDKGTYKALTGAQKYLLFKLFQIETGDDPEQDEPTSHNKTQIDAAEEDRVARDWIFKKLGELDDPIRFKKFLDWDPFQSRYARLSDVHRMDVDRELAAARKRLRIPDEQNILAAG